MVVDNDLGYAEIRNIFNERDRRATISGTSVRKIDSSAVRRGSSSAKPRTRHYERTPDRDEFIPSQRKSSSVQNGKRTQAREERKAREAQQDKRSKAERSTGSDSTTTQPAKLNTRNKLALTLALLTGVTSLASYAACNTEQSEAIAAAKIPYSPPNSIVEDIDRDTIINNIVMEDGDNTYIIDDIIDFNNEALDELNAAAAAIEESKEPDYIIVEHASDNVLEAIKNTEGLRLEAYYCPSGKLTIGYGHTAGVYEGQTLSCEEEAMELLREDVAIRENIVFSYIDKINENRVDDEKYYPTQGEFDAMVDFTYNCGEGNFRDSGIVEALADGDRDEAARIIKLYVKGRNEKGESVTMGGLVRRREMEAGWLYS